MRRIRSLGLDSVLLALVFIAALLLAAPFLIPGNDNGRQLPICGSAWGATCQPMPIGEVDANGSFLPGSTWRPQQP